MQILVPKFIEPNDNVDGKIGLYGEFQVVKKRRGIIVQDLKFRNLILDSGLRQLAAGTSPFDASRYAYLGTGTATPVSTDTVLQAPTNGYCTSNSALYLEMQGAGADRWLKHTYEYGLSSVIGNWTEVGLSWTSQSTGCPTLFCRTLFKDEQGNPITVQKTGDDTLTITYTLHLVRQSDSPLINTINVPGVGDVTVETLLLNGGVQTSMQANLQWMNPATYGNDAGYNRIGTGTSALTATRTGCQTPINTEPTICQAVTYQSGTYYRELLFEWPTSVVGNISEAGWIHVFFLNGATRGTQWMNRFTPAIPKDNTKKFRLRPRITFNRIAS